MKMIRVVFFVFLTFLPYPARGEVVPMTEGRLAEFRNTPKGERFRFLMDFYKESKKKGATDQEILDEIIKIPEIQDSELFQNLIRYTKNLKNIDSYLNTAAEKLNKEIMKLHPDKPELLIDPDDTGTWKNAQYAVFTKKTLEDYIEEFFNKDYYSNTVKEEEASLITATCGFPYQNDPPLSGIAFYPAKGWRLLYAREGEKPEPVSIDFSHSAGVKTDKVLFPAPVKIPEGFGYDKPVSFLFKTYPADKDSKNGGTLNAVVSATMCRDGECRLKTFPAMSVKVARRTLSSSVCTDLNDRYYRLNPAAKAFLRKIEASFSRPGKGPVLLTVKIKTGFLLKERKPVLILMNENGLKLTKVSEFDEKNVFVFRYAVENAPEKSLSVPFEYFISFGDKTEGGRILVKENAPFSIRRQGLFGNLTNAIAVLLYLLVFTPFAALAVVLFCQMIDPADESVRDADDFFDGWARSVLPTAVFMALLAGVAALFPSLYWGVQFSSPLLNGVWIAAFAAGGYVFFEQALKKDVPFLSALRFRRPAFSSERERTGFLCGLIIAVLLPLSPHITLFRIAGRNWAESPVVHTVVVIGGLLAFFCAEICFDNRLSRIKTTKGRVYRWLVPVFFGIQIVSLAVTIYLEAGAERTLLFGALFVSTFAALLFMKDKARVILPAAAVLTIIILPFSANRALMPSAVPFSEEKLKETLDKGQAVIVSVMEPACLFCRSSVQALNDANNENLYRVMTAPFSDAFLKATAREAGALDMPLNVLFLPDGKMSNIMPAVVSDMKARDIKSDYLTGKNGEALSKDPDAAPAGPQGDDLSAFEEKDDREKERTTPPPAEQTPPAETPPTVEDQR